MRIADLDEEKFPALAAYFRRTKGKAVLMNILSCLQTYEKPAHITQQGEGWYTLSTDYLIRKYGGSKATWQSHIIYLLELGLLKRIKPGKNTENPLMKQSYTKATESNRRSQSWYHVPVYTDRRLANAEKAVQMYEQVGISPSNLNKAGVIAVQGKKHADKLYLDRRNISELQTAIEFAIIHKARYALKAHGYITKELLFERVMKSLYFDTLKTTPGEAYQKLRNIWSNKRKHLMKRLDAEYRRPTKEEKARLGLLSDKWVIVMNKEPIFSIYE